MILNEKISFLWGNPNVHGMQLRFSIGRVVARGSSMQWHKVNDRNPGKWLHQIFSLAREVFHAMIEIPETNSVKLGIFAFVLLALLLCAIRLSEIFLRFSSGQESISEFGILFLGALLLILILRGGGGPRPGRRLEVLTCSKNSKPRQQKKAA